MAKMAEIAKIVKEPHNCENPSCDCHKEGECPVCWVPDLYGKRFTLDDELISSIYSFIAENELELYREYLFRLARLKVKETIIFGGGAMGEFVLRRIK